jgi:hypothetical protein
VTPSSSIINVHNEAIALGQNSVFNMLFNTQQFVASIILRQPQPPQLWWSPDYKRVTITNHLINIEQVWSGLQDMLKSAWTLLYKITGGKKFANNLSEHFIDDLNKTTRDYSFLDHGPSTKEPHTLISYLISHLHWKFSSINADGRLSYNMPAIYDYQNTSAELNRILCVLCYVLPNIST